jgi:hypothetical protein
LRGSELLVAPVLPPVLLGKKAPGGEDNGNQQQRVEHRLNVELVAGNGEERFSERFPESPVDPAHA